MKKPTLEQVIKLASQLSPEDRQELFLFIAQLPDSAIKTSVQVSSSSLPLSLDEKKKFDAAAKTDRMYVLASDTVALVFQRGRLIFQIVFFPENFLRSRMEIHSWKDSQDTGEVNAEVRRALALVHAGRFCLPDVFPPYSLKTLKEKLKLSKREKEPHPKSSK